MAGDTEALSGLIAALVEKTRVLAATEHVGHTRRLVRQREEILAAIAATPGGQAVLHDLLNHTDARLKLAIAHYCKSNELWRQEADSVLARLPLRSDKIGRAALEMQYAPE